MTKLWKTVTAGILGTMLMGAVTAVASMYMDVDRLKHKEKTLEQKIDRLDKKADVIDENVKKIRLFLIERNGGNITKKR